MSAVSPNVQGPRANVRARPVASRRAAQALRGQLSQQPIRLCFGSGRPFTYNMARGALERPEIKGMNIDLINALNLDGKAQAEIILHPQFSRWPHLPRSLIDGYLRGNDDAPLGEDWQLIDGFYVKIGRAELQRLRTRRLRATSDVYSAETSDAGSFDDAAFSDQSSTWGDDQ
eukprot:TRINITY_DN71975_c0_g1_i1.p1 TRINITY_DN71975_c0_g1~~TRINITY_DN71975_c0_g1_i1.p1  ORF type:complete len:173 (+),score=24.76 TRINITY_DN71975_c0_g1_i1:106-624(+)